MFISHKDSSPFSFQYGLTCFQYVGGANQFSVFVSFAFRGFIRRRFVALSDEKSVVKQYLHWHYYVNGNSTIYCCPESKRAAATYTR